MINFWIISRRRNRKFAYRPLRGAPRINVLITAVGVSLFIEYSGQQIFGSSPRYYPEIYHPAGAIELGNLTINPLQIVVLTISLTLMLILQFVIFKTRIGRAMRAVSFNHDIASLMGIPTNKIISFTFMVGSALAGAAGVLVGLIYPKIDPLMGVMLGLKLFCLRRSRRHRKYLRCRNRCANSGYVRGDVGGIWKPFT